MAFSTNKFMCSLYFLLFSKLRQAIFIDMAHIVLFKFA